MNPSCSWAALERAGLAELQEKYTPALRFYLQALDGDMDFLITPWPHEQMKQVLYVSVGYCYDLLGKREDAVRWYKKTIALGRDPRFAYYFDKAVEYLKKPAPRKK
jgi:tetratricopeptide (TPR) repeat protein